MSDLLGPANTSLGALARRPAIVCAIALVLGIFLHDRVPIWPGWLIAMALAAVIAATTFLRGTVACSVLLSAGILISGTAIAQCEHFRFASNDIAQFATQEPHMCELELYLPDEPQLLVVPSGQRELPPKQIVIAQVMRIKTWNGWIPATGRLPLQIDQTNPSLDVGQTVQALGMLQRPRAAMNPGEFDWAAYYREQRILATFTVSRSANCHVVFDPGPSSQAWLRLKARHLLAAGFTQSDAIEHALLKALLLGDRDPELRDIKEEFMQAGVSYQISVSGMHVAILGGAVFLLCRWMRLRPRWSLTIFVGFVLLYAAVSLPAHSGIRSVILCVVAAGAMCSGRAVDRAQLLAIAVIGMLLWHPMDLFSIGFQISFAVVTVFVVLVPKLDEWDREHRDMDKIAARQEPTWLRAIGERTYAIALRTIQFSILAWLATLPLVAYYFGQLTPWAIIGSVLTLPVVIASLFAGALKVFLTLCWPSAAGSWATFAGWPAHAMIRYVHLLTRFPAWTVPLPAPPVWLIVSYYVLLLAVVIPETWVSGKKRGFLRLAPLVGVVSMLALPMLTKPAAATNIPTDLRITLLSLGAGQCAIIEPPGGHAVIFDAGSSTVSDLTAKIISPFLRSQNQRHIDEIFLSHGDFDHISAVGDIAATYDVHQVMMSYHFRHNAEGNIPDQILLDELEKLNLTPHEIATGDHFDLGSGAMVNCLWPPKAGELNSNNAGLVLRLTFAGKTILFPADIQDPAMQQLLVHPAELKSDLLIAAHHGSSEDLTPAFLAAVHPSSIISSNAWRLTNKQKRFDTMVGNTPLYRTSDYGAITVTIQQSGTISIQTFVKAKKAS